MDSYNDDITARGLYTDKMDSYNDNITARGLYTDKMDSYMYPGQRPGLPEEQRTMYHENLQPAPQ